MHFIYKWLKKCRFLTALSPLGPLTRLASASPLRSSLDNVFSVYVGFSCCLSRACLGKRSDCIRKLRRPKNGFRNGFRTVVLGAIASSEAAHQGLSSPEKTVVSFFECSFPMFVPSLSWYEDHIYIQMAQNYCVRLHLAVLSSCFAPVLQLDSA
jgi:hypothetical protein